MATATCEIDFRLDDTPASLIRLINHLGPILRLNRPEDNWAIFLSNPTIGIFATTVIASIVNDAERLEQVCSVTVPVPFSKSMAETGFAQWMQSGQLPDVIPDSEATAPLHQIDLAVYSASDPIIDMVRRNAHMTPDDEEYLRISLNEVIFNVEDHAGSETPAIRCARWDARRRRVRIAIVDRGVGIYTTLRRRFPDTVNTAMALRRVIGGDYSAKSRPTNMGVGINTLWAHVTRQLGGQLIILSENCIVSSGRGGRPVATNLATRFPGTGVFLSVPVSVKKRA